MLPRFLAQNRCRILFFCVSTNRSILDSAPSHQQQPVPDSRLHKLRRTSGLQRNLGNPQETYIRSTYRRQVAGAHLDASFDISFLSARPPLTASLLTTSWCTARRAVGGYIEECLRLAFPQPHTHHVSPLPVKPFWLDGTIPATVVLKDRTNFHFNTLSASMDMSQSQQLRAIAYGVPLSPPPFNLTFRIGTVKMKKNGFV